MSEKFVCKKPTRMRGMRTDYTIVHASWGDVLLGRAWGLCQKCDEYFKSPQEDAITENTSSICLDCRKIQRS